MGFNNGGIDAALARVAKAKRRGILGINVGANKESNDRIGDYRIGVARAAPLADYVTINISSPNTPGLRDLQHGAALDELLAAAPEARGSTPLVLQVAPDLDLPAYEHVDAAAIAHTTDTRIAAPTPLPTAAQPTLHRRQTGR